MLTVVPDPADRGNPAPSSLIDEIVREGARQMLAEALAAEVDAYIARRVHLRHGTAPHQVTKGPGSRAAGLAMAFKLIESAQDRWRAVNAPHLVALVRGGAAFINGKHVEHPIGEGQPQVA